MSLCPFSLKAPYHWLSTTSVRHSAEDLMGEGGIFKQLTKALIERCLSAELDTDLAEEKAEPEIDSLRDSKAERPKNRRKGQSKKTIKGADNDVDDIWTSVYRSI